jgi:hypothetical protein
VPDETAGFPSEDTTPVEVTRWTCDHAELVAALHRTRQCRWMNDPALATMAREILGRLPETPAASLPFGENGPTKPCGCGPDEPCEEHADTGEPDSRDAEIARLKVYITHLNAEIARLKTERAEMTGQLIMAKEGVFRS